MSDPKTADYQPKKVELLEGKKYQWCACGASKKQPYCDGGHKGSPFLPTGFRAEESGDAWMCMCKKTKNPPYCDGSHKALNPEENVKEYQYTNGEITVVWKPSFCIHSANCIKALPAMYTPGERPWVKMEQASTAEIIEQMKTCPSGALSYFMNKDMPKKD